MAVVTKVSRKVIFTPARFVNRFCLETADVSFWAADGAATTHYDRKGENI